jgi:hypothetical protein
LIFQFNSVSPRIDFTGCGAYSRSLDRQVIGIEFLHCNIYAITQPTKCPQRNNLCNLYFIATLSGYLESENQNAQSGICIVYSVTGPKCGIYIFGSIEEVRM